MKAESDNFEAIESIKTVTWMSKNNGFKKSIFCMFVGFANVVQDIFYHQT